MLKRHLLALALCVASTASFAQQGPDKVPVDAATRKAVIAELSSQLKANYVFPDVAAQLATSLAAKEASGGRFKTAQAPKLALVQK